MSNPVPQDEVLYPGDMLDVEYRITPGANQAILNLAIKKIKETLWGDKRFNYMSSWIESRVDKSGLDGSVQEVQHLIVRLEVRKGPKADRVEIQEAGVVGTVALSAALTAVAVAVIHYANVLKYRTHEIHRIATDPTISDEVKVAALKAVGKGPGIDLGVGMAGGSLLTIGIVVVVLWALSFQGRRQGGD